MKTWLASQGGRGKEGRGVFGSGRTAASARGGADSGGGRTHSWFVDTARTSAAAALSICRVGSCWRCGRRCGGKKAEKKNSTSKHLCESVRKANMLIQATLITRTPRYFLTNANCYARLKMLMRAAICGLSLCLAGPQPCWARPNASRLSAPLRSPPPSAPGKRGP